MATYTFRSRRKIGRWLVLPAVVAVGLAAACTAPGKGALILAVSTDMQAPKDVSVLSFFIETDGVPKFDYIGRVLPDGTVSLPSTLAIVQPDNPSAQVRIRVIAFQEQTPRVVRDVLTTVPEGRTALLRLPLNFLDDGSALTTTTLPAQYLPSSVTSVNTTQDVPDGVTDFDPDMIATKCDFQSKGQTSVNGVCVSATVDPTVLPDYSDDLVFGNGGTATSLNCFDVGSCFQGATPVTNVDLTTCSFPVPPTTGNSVGGAKDASAPPAADGGSSSTGGAIDAGAANGGGGALCGKTFCSSGQVCCAGGGGGGSNPTCTSIDACSGSILCNGATCAATDVCCTVGSVSQCASASVCALLQTMAGAPDASTGTGSSSGSTGGAFDDASAVSPDGSVLALNAPADISSGSAASGGSSGSATSGGVTGPSLNFALVTSNTGLCLTSQDCFVPIENDTTPTPTDGWVVTGNTVQMAPGICAKLSAGAQLFMVYGSCAPKAEAAPVCEPSADSSQASDGGAIRVDSSTGTGGSSGGTSGAPDAAVEFGDSSTGTGGGSSGSIGGSGSGSTPATDAGSGGPSTPLVGVTAIAAGAYHTCAVLSNGTVACWGQNINGQLGNGTTTESKTPVLVNGVISKPVAITAGTAHTCLLASDGSVQCWGDNSAGQLGNGGTTQSLFAVAVPGLPGATAISAGGGFTCALISDGTVQCWGFNSTSQLGNGGTAESPTPVVVSGLSNATAIAAGGTFACALISDGTVECWGSNLDGELGDGTVGVSSPTPVAVSTVTNAIGIAAGSLHACAILADGSVTCWGDNSNGQLGDGTTTIEPTPVPTAALQGPAVALAGGQLHTCAVLSSGTVECWGENNIGQLGTGTATQSPTPTMTQLPASATGIAAGETHSCAMTNGGLECWGSNQYGQLGAQNQATLQSLTPLVVYTTLAVP